MRPASLAPPTLPRSSVRGRCALACALVALACAPAHAEADDDGKAKQDRGRKASIAQLWVEPANLESGDLFWGPGGRESAPAAEAIYRFVELEQKGHSAGYELEDPRGRRWKAKVGDEAQAEIVASRLLWAIGYHQPVMHYMKRWRMSGGPVSQPAAARFRLESAYEKKGPWGFKDNPFEGSRELHGLIVANLVVGNWDLDKDNNRIYEPKRPGGGPDVWYVVQDVGASLGRSKFPIGTRNLISDFESEELVLGLANGKPKFDHHSYHTGLLEDIDAADVVWACRLIGRLSDRQLGDAFRAADYSPSLAARYIRKIRERIAQGLALERAARG